VGHAIVIHLALLLAIALTLVTATMLYVLAPFIRPPAVNTSGRDRTRDDTLDILRERHLELTTHLPETSPERLKALTELAQQAGRELGPSPSPLSAAPRPRNRKLALIWALALSGMSGGLYWQIGDPDAVRPGATANHPAGSLDEFSQMLQRRVQREPDNIAAWQFLGQAYLVQGQPEAAATALERAHNLAPQDADIKADWADAIGQSQGRRLDGRPIALLREALTLEPKHPKALALAGAYAVSQQDIPGALNSWRTLLTVLPPDAPQAAQIRGFVADLEAGHAPRVPAASAPATTAKDKESMASAPHARLEGSIRIAPTLLNRVRPDDTLFVLARLLDAKGQAHSAPVAVMRTTARDLPKAFTLDDRHAMTPSSGLSSLTAGQQLQVIARISRSGQAPKQAGDLQGASAPVLVGASMIDLVIDQVVE
jgi:cytochrome c-type biogenesis protein CcmH